MAAPLRLALIWHFHQPWYFPPGQDPTPTLPWVRLHASLGYLDMLAALEAHEGMRCTLNWTPVLVEQLQRAAAGVEDDWLRCCRRDPRDWTPGEQRFLTRRLQYRPPDRRHRACDDARRERLVRALADERLDDAVRADLLDEVVRFHLGWCGNDLRRHPEVEALAERDGGHDVADRDRLLALQNDAVGTVLERARALHSSGRVEACCTPYHHPILPLVLGLDSSEYPHAADGGGPFRFAWPDDAHHHVREAVRRHGEVFGAAPRGMWPAEGAVSEAAAACFAKEGLSWIASDEAILFASLGHEDRAALYRPARRETEHGPLHVLFRDRDLSDRIGFRYSRWSAQRAVDDFIGRLEEIGRDHEGATVAVILDGENPWEHYHRSGGPFLDELYRRLSEHEAIEPVTAAEAALGASEPTELSTVATGSWIGGSLDTWAGHPEKLAAWRRLAEARAREGASLDDTDAARAHSLRVLQSSDWFWWLGDDHPSPLREEFDALFGRHLAFVLREQGIEPPGDLIGSLRWDSVVQPYRRPRDWVQPTGRPGDLLEWLGAGEVHPLTPGGSMTETEWPRRVLYGFEPGPDGTPRALHLGVWPSGTGVRLRVGRSWARPHGPSPSPQGTVDHYLVSLRPDTKVALRLESAHGRWPDGPGVPLLAVGEGAGDPCWMV